jgi:hypothetical protein
VEIFGIILFMNVCIFGYFIHNFIQYRKREKYRTQELNHKVQYLLDQMERDYQASLLQEEEPVTNIFREHVIEEISRHRLIYDEKTGRYIKLRQIE